MDVADEDQENQARVDELIDRGLEHYGDGALKEALAEWKHAQALSPSCERVREYIKLVESHYEMSKSDNDGEDEDDGEDEELTMERPANPKGTSGDGWNMDDDWDEPSDDDALPATNQPQDGIDLAAPISESVRQDSTGTAVERSSAHESAVSGEILSGTSLHSGRKSASPQGGSESDESEVSEDDRTKSFLVLDTDGQLELEPSSRIPSTRFPLSNTKSNDPDRTETLSRQFEQPNFELEIADDSEDEEGGTLELAPMNLGDLGLGEREEANEPSTPPTTSGLSFDDELTNFHVSLNPTEKSDGEAKDDVKDLELDSSRPPVALSESRSTLELRISDRPVVDTDGNEAGMLSFEEATKELDLNSMEMGPSFGSANPSDTRSQTPPSEHVVMTQAVPESLADVQSGGIDLGLSEEEMSELQVGETPTAGTSEGILAEICETAPSGNASERTSYIVTKLIKHVIDMTEQEQFRLAASSSMHALEYADDNAIAQKLVVESERQLIRALIFGLGDLSEIPRLLVPMTEIPFEEIDHRAAFLLTRLDGTLTLEEILDVSGMPRLEALRHLTRLFVRGYVLVE